MKTILLVTLTLYSALSYAGDKPQTNTTQTNAAAAAMSSSSSNSNSEAAATGGAATANGSTFKTKDRLQIPAASAATAGARAQVDPCPIITEVSNGKSIGWGAASKSDVGIDPSRTNGLCVLFHIAKTTNKEADWEKFSDYACATDPIYTAIACVQK